MRIPLTILVSLTFLFTKAQSHLPIGNPGYGYPAFSPIIPYSLHDIASQNRGWQLRPYASVSAGYIFLNGGISYLSAPVGLMLFHPLNNNVSAFAGISAAPTFFSFSRLYAYPGINSSYPGNNFSNHNSLGINGRVEGGLIYTNDAKTFSISGSVGIEKNSYPVYPYNRPNPPKQ